MSLQSVDQDPILNKQMRTGAEIRIDVIDSTATTVRMFTGRIDSIFTHYAPDGSMNLDIYALDAMKQIMNSGYTPGVTPPFGTISEVLEYVVGLTGITPSASSETSAIPTWYPLASDGQTNDIVNWLIDGSQGWFMITRTNDEFTFYNSAHTANAIAAGPLFTFSNVHSTDPTHVCLTDINLAFDTFDQANLVYATLLDGVTSYHEQNDDSVELYGVTRGDFDVPALLSESQLIYWVRGVIKRMANKLVKEVAVNGLRPDGTLTDIITLEQGDAIKTEFTRNGETISETSVVARITHSLTPEAWDAKIEIWRGN